MCGYWLWSTVADGIQNCCCSVLFEQVVNGCSKGHVLRMSTIMSLCVIVCATLSYIHSVVYSLHHMSLLWLCHSFYVYYICFLFFLYSVVACAIPDQTSCSAGIFSGWENCCKGI